MENPSKPVCKLVDEDGNIFSILGKASRVLKQAGMKDQAKKMKEEVFTFAKSYDQALGIVMRYVDAE